MRTNQRNELRFEVLNNGGGYTYGFELQGNDRPLYKDVKGTPGIKNVVKSSGEEGQDQGLVYAERFVINDCVSPVGSGPFWMKISNLNQDEALVVSANNDLDDIAWPDGYFRVTGAMGTVSRALPTRAFDPAEDCGTSPLNFGCWHPA